MAHWLFETGIGEDRAILVGDDAILEAAIELPGGLRAGTVAEARLTAILIQGRRGIVRLDGGEEALLEPIPAGVSEGGRLRVEIVREKVAEECRDKLPKARATDAPLRPGRRLRDRVGAGQERPRWGADPFEAAGWSELLETARTGEVPFQGGALRMSLTPAMTLFDVDGALPPAALAVAGARAAGQAIRRFGIGGSIGIDLPTLADRGERQAAAAALDAVLPQPFERTAVNGFGFMQIVRRRERASLPELISADPPGAAARALLRLAERRTGALTLVAAPGVIARLEAEPGWTAELSRRTGGPVALQADPKLTTFAGYVHAQPS